MFCCGVLPRRWLRCYPGASVTKNNTKGCGQFVACRQKQKFKLASIGALYNDDAVRLPNLPFDDCTLP